MFKNTTLNYVKILIPSISLKNFTSMGKFNRVCADTIQRKLQLEDHSHKEMLKIYKKRWTIEKMFRTARQYFGLQDCQAIKMQTHKNHIASVFLAYSHVIIEQKRKGLKSAEEAIRALKL